MATLNPKDFSVVTNDDFTKDKSLNTSIWGSHWGYADQFTFTGTGAGLLLSGSQSEHWNPVGIQQTPSGKSAGEGYGLYSFTGYAGQAGQGVGICFVLWPSDNVWLPSNAPGQASEIDLLESWDKTVTDQSTLHYYQAGSNHNGQISFTVSNIDLTKSHTYAMDWEQGSLTYYVDGQEIYRDTAHAPLDYAHGGVNRTMGAEVVNEASGVTTPTVQLYIQDISYAKPISAATTPPPPILPPPVVAASIVVNQPATLVTGLDSFTGSVSGHPQNVYLAWHSTGNEVNGASDFVKVAVAADGSFSTKINVDHAGVLSSLWADVDGTVSKLFSMVPHTPALPPSKAPPVRDPGPMPILAITTLTESPGGLLLTGTKNLGAVTSLREALDGQYIGVLRDQLADGAFSMHIADVTAGPHALRLSLGGSTAGVTYDFTKLGSSIIHGAGAVIPAAAAIQLPAPHEPAVATL